MKHTRETINKKFVLSRGIAATAAVSIVGLFAAPANAAEPANQACLGTTLSPLASNQPAPGAFGAGIVSFAQEPVGQPGLGDSIYFLQAGLVDDAVVPNTCND